MATRNINNPGITRGPGLGNVPFDDSYLRLKQNIDALYQTVGNFQSAISGLGTNLSPVQLNIAQQALQATGSNPLNLTGLIPLNNLNTVQLVGTHAQRLASPASSYSVGTLFFETDRTIVYTVLQVAGGSRWVYEDGIFNAPIASRPTDLGTYDAGFLFYATDQSITYKWSGSAWVAKGELGVTLSDTHANRVLNFAANNYPIGATFFESDRTSLYRDTGNNWNFMVGIMRSTNNNIPGNLNATDTGFGFYATDTFAESFWNGANFVNIPRVFTVNNLSGNVTLAPASNNVTITPQNNGTILIDSSANGSVPGVWTNWAANASILITGGATLSGVLFDCAYSVNGKQIMFRFAISFTIASNVMTGFTVSSPAPPRNTGFGASTGGGVAWMGNNLAFDSSWVQSDAGPMEVVLNNAANIAAGSPQYVIAFSGVYEGS